MLPSTNNKNKNPYAWRGGDTSTFAAQAKNLGEQVGNQGLDMGQIDVQRRTAEAKQKAAQTAQNVAAGADAVATGAKVDPTIAYAPQKPNASGIANPKIGPYEVKEKAPDEPDLSINEKVDYGQNAQFKDPTMAYLESIFPNGIPDSIRNKLDETKSKIINPEWQKFEDYRQTVNQKNAGYTPNPNAQYIPNPENTNFADAYQAYLDEIKNYQAGKSPQDVEQFKNAIKNQLNDQLTQINTAYQKGQMDLATQNTAKQKAISDYINKLQGGLSDYQKQTQDLGNVGKLSESELASANRNSILAGDNVSGASALSALSHGGPSNSRLNALSQQAQNAAIQEAMGAAGAAQEQEKSSEKQLDYGQKAQEKAYDEAGKSITKKQEGYFKKLDEGNTAAQKELADVYNNTVSSLNKQEQDFVGKAQDTLKNANVPEGSIKAATQGFAELVKNKIEKGNMSEQEKQSLKSNLEAIWRIAVGTNKSDMRFSDEIAGILLPLANQLGEGKLNAPT